MAQIGQRVTPLRVHATVSGPIALPDGTIHLDSLLMAQVARERGLVCLDATMLVPLEIPIQREPRGRFFLCSQGVYMEAASELQHTYRRPIIAEAQRFAEPKVRRINITVGANKGYRIPRPVQYLESGIEWWCIGNHNEIERLLSCITHLGKRRSAGLGAVDGWTVAPCDPWDGFPVVRDGKPLRPLPVDWPGAEVASCGFRVMAPPYWDMTMEEPCLLP